MLVDGDWTEQLTPLTLILGYYNVILIDEINEFSFKKFVWDAKLEGLNTYFIILLKIYKWVMCTCEKISPKSQNILISYY